LPIRLVVQRPAPAAWLAVVDHPSSAPTSVFDTAAAQRPGCPVHSPGDLLLAGGRRRQRCG
jgi:hypothetical protein